MIAEAVLQIAQRMPQAEAIVDSRRCWTYADLVNAANAIAITLNAPKLNKVGVWCSDAATMIATLLAANSAGVSAVLFYETLNSERVARLADELQLDRVLTDVDASAYDKTATACKFQQIELHVAAPTEKLKTSLETSPQVVLFTSGTSGQPKPAVHTWRSLSAGVSHEPKYFGRKWLLAYAPTSFAGIQVWVQALLTGGCVYSPPMTDYAVTIEFLIRHRVEFASATPTFWRMLLHASPSDFTHTSLVQITLGGEAVDQLLLDALRHAFPKVRITHIYASTEMGSCFAVHDGLAGFPAAFLDDVTRPCQLRISASGELEIRSRRAMLGYLENSTNSVVSSDDLQAEPGDWFATGDLVERRGDRIHFVGRKSETINVGGAKVYPLQVEECIQCVGGVDAVRVYGVPSSLTGQLVCAEVKASPVEDQESLRRNILAACRTRLARHQIPALIKFNEHLAVNGSAKLVRSEVVHGS